MNRIDQTFKSLRSKRKKALIGYLTVGFPKLSQLPALARAVVDNGVDLLELGVPFSDPLADGPTIQAASEKALRQGVSPKEVLRQVRILRKQGIEVPIALLTYYNPVLHYGLKNFCKDAAAAGVDGLIVPDLPPEEAQELVAQARPNKLHTIFLAAPTSSTERLKRLAKMSTGFLYYVSLTGVTGARKALPKELMSHVRAIKRLAPKLPVCVGFGISTPEQVRQVVQVADGAIVGSALIQVIGRANGNPAQAAGKFIKLLRRACV